jgi:hypothetical protein
LDAGGSPLVSSCAAGSDSTSARNSASSPQARSTNAFRSAAGRLIAAKNVSFTREWDEGM